MTLWCSWEVAVRRQPGGGPTFKMSELFGLPSLSFSSKIFISVVVSSF